MLLNADSFRVIMGQMNIPIPKSDIRKPHQKIKNRAEVLGIVASNPSITRQNIAKLTSMATSTVYRVISDLEKSGYIKKALGSGKTKYGNEFFSITDKKSKGDSNE